MKDNSKKPNAYFWCSQPTFQRWLWNINFIAVNNRITERLDHQFYQQGNSAIRDFLKNNKINHPRNALMSSVLINSLTHWGRDKMAAIFQTTYSKAFSWMKMYKFWLKFHWSLFLRVQLTIIQHRFRKWLGADQATSHYLNQGWKIYWRIYASLGLNELNKQ